VTAIVVAKAGHSLDESRVLAHAAAQLAPFKCPKAVVFVDALPKNPSGKLLKRELRLRWRDHYSAR
jgi:fatty-acyl-CoA synthase